MQLALAVDWLQSAMEIFKKMFEDPRNDANGDPHPWIYLGDSTSSHVLPLSIIPLHICYLYPPASATSSSAAAETLNFEVSALRIIVNHVLPG
jgi:hypothetical protein